MGKACIGRLLRSPWLVAVLLLGAIVGISLFRMARRRGLLRAAPRLPVREGTLERPATYWAREGFVRMEGPVRAPTSPDGRERIVVYLRLPASSVVKTRLLDGDERPTLEYPPGTLADRVEYWGDGPLDAPIEPRWRVADVRGTSYQTFEDLLHYCRCVAGSIGRLSLGIYGTSGDAELAAQLADSLGVALQLTNILRDVREDYQNGRVYLPSEDLAKFDVALDVPSESQFSRLVEFEVERARDWYATGLRLLPMLDWRSAACTGAMAGIYRRLLERIAAQPAEVLRGRMSLSTGEKAAVAVKALAGRIG